ncbi:TIGR03084 family metal-binding protein [Streptomyces sp. TS71-3]|uniref:TIGR03084 family metal-binding protein n=1 Tax=Streptomyces sp. TS71-3 TaxID=2733862 RepID=UPI001B290A7A|nr:TIGR03084 family metal-binding protein [Streptomyces sp. TS71-3]GHJ39883.1 TIGR03084 family protein [Streptomyces sp. TS71-3]
MSDPRPVLDDLRAESEELDQLVSGLSAREWAAETPAPGWTVAHQIAHLAWTDRAALLAATDTDAFAAQIEEAAAAPDTYIDDAAQAGAVLLPSELMARWRAGREELQRLLRAAPDGTRFPWYGPPMSPAGVATGRIMETWAHGKDVADTLGVVREPTDRLRHVVRIGVRARDFAYLVHGLRPPEEEFRVELTAASGEVWAHGPEDAAQRVTGSAVDFCLLVTQRAHRSDVDVHADGPDADEWLDIAQAFAGPPGEGRAPGTPSDGTDGPR